MLRSPTLEDPARRFLPGALQRLQRRYGQGGSGEASPAERAWGLMAPATYREILDVTRREEYEPRFREPSLL